VLLGSLATFSIVAWLQANQNQVDERTYERAYDNEEITRETPKSSDNFALTEVVLIDGDLDGVDAHNWTWAVAQDWCSGAGTEGDPYLIENVSISVDDGSNPALKIMDNATVFITLSNVTVTNANVDGDGVWIEDCANIIINNCNFNDNGNYGLYMINVNATTITSTNCIGNGYGIYMDNCVLNTLTALNCSENAIDGIDLINCTYNVISSSYFQTNTADGLWIEDSDLNNITVESDDNNRGLVLRDSDNCIVSDSEFWDNTAYGIILIEDDGDTLDNLIYNNLFSGNDVNAVDNATDNDWDNGALGNEWDDYSGVDANDNGIGDTPYLIDGTAGASDNFPIFSDGAEPVVVPLPTSDDDDDDDEEPTYDLGVPLTWIVFSVIGVFALTKFAKYWTKVL